MKTVSIFAMVLTLYANLSLAASPISIYQTPTATYTPFGFDNNDNAQIVFEGSYPNSCYQFGLTEFEVDEESKSIVVSNKAYFYANQMCMMVIVPYFKTLDLGLLSPGQYKVFFRKEVGVVDAGQVIVQLSENSGPDDKIYLPVEEAYFVAKKENVSAKVYLEGFMPNSCWSLSNVELSKLEGSNTIQILPLAKVAEGDCVETKTPFKIPVDLQQYEGAGRTLLHIRSLNGQAINKMGNL